MSSTIEHKYLVLLLVRMNAVVSNSCFDKGNLSELFVFPRRSNFQLNNHLVVNNVQIEQEFLSCTCISLFAF